MLLKLLFLPVAMPMATARNAASCWAGLLVNGRGKRLTTANVNAKCKSNVFMFAIDV